MKMVDFQFKSKNTNKLPRDRASGVLNHNFRSHRPRAAEALAEAQAEREGRINEPGNQCYDI